MIILILFHFFKTNWFFSLLAKSMVSLDRWATSLDINVCATRRPDGPKWTNQQHSLIYQKHYIIGKKNGL